MNTSVTEIVIPVASSVAITDDTLCVDLLDGRTISVPLGWYPRLLTAKDPFRSGCLETIPCRKR